MNAQIQIELFRLTDGARLLRLSEPTSGLCLEKRLDAQQPVARQKEHWRRCFEALLQRELPAA